MTMEPPGPSWTELPRLVSDMLDDELVAFESLVLEHGDLVRFPFKPGMPAYIVCRPDWVQHILQDNQRNYVKAPTYEALRPVLGNGLLLSDGEYWRRQRRLIAPMFHRQAIAKYVGTMVRHTREMLDTWEEFEEGEVVDILGEMMRLTLGITGEILFSRDVRGEASNIADALGVVMHEAIERIINPLRVPLGIPTRKNLKVRRSLGLLEGIVDDLVSDRRGRETEHQDMLSMLMTAEDADTGEMMTDKQVRDEVITFILAGHETTSNALAWAWHSISLHPTVRRVLELEIDGKLAGDPTLEQLAELDYTGRVFDETTRLYPPAWTIERTPLEDDKLGDFEIPAGAILMTAPYFVHRNPSVWENPLGFDPQRFTEENRKKHHRLAHFPFGGGPRKCPGADFAQMEAKIVLAMVTQRFRLDAVPGVRITPEATITLRPRWGKALNVGLPMHVRPRGE